MTKCKRCGRTDLTIISNGYCTRCDAVLFGMKDGVVVHVPPKKPDQTPMRAEE